MYVLQFKTNLKCEDCVAKVKTDMNEAVGADNWAVDLSDPDRILTVKGAEKDDNAVIAALEKNGYKATAL